MVQPDLPRPTRDYAERLDDLIAAGDRDGAVKHFMLNAVGIPAPFVTLMRFTPMWKGLRATAHTLPADWAALGAHTMYGAAARSAGVGGRDACPRSWSTAPRAPSRCVRARRRSPPCCPTHELRELAGVSHNVKAGAVVPVIASFFAGKPSAVNA